MIMGPTSKHTGGGTIKNNSVMIEKDIFVDHAHRMEIFLVLEPIRNVWI